MTVVKKYHKRTFLNDDPSMTGIVATNLEVYKYKHENKNKINVTKHEIFGSISISDCNRMVTLDFECASKSKLITVKRKIARLKDAILRAEQFVNDNEHYINKNEQLELKNKNDTSH